jgi:hypothetical protein
MNIGNRGSEGLPGRRPDGRMDEAGQRHLTEYPHRPVLVSVGQRTKPAWGTVAACVTLAART